MTENQINSNTIRTTSSLSIVRGLTTTIKSMREYYPHMIKCYTVLCFMIWIKHFKLIFYTYKLLLLGLTVWNY